MNQLEGQAIKSTNNSFSQARNKLSALYTLVFGLLIFAVSGILYHMFASDIHEDMRSIYSDESVQTRIINQHKATLFFDVIIINGLILIFISGASFYIAGKTLKPISDNYEAQKRFIADASHDLRTPIAVLTADLEVSLRDSTMSRPVKKLLKSNLEEVSHMKQIVEDLLLLYRFDSNTIDVLPEYIDIYLLLKKCALSMKSLANKNTISFKFQSPTMPIVQGDTSLLQRAFRNVFKNAIEYSINGKNILIDLTQQDKFIHIKITNWGIVISDEDAIKVFERFFRTDNAVVARRTGSGLGLPISKEIIEKHGGTISISSDTTGKTSVLIRLPIHLQS